MSIPLSKVLDALREDLKEAQRSSDPENPFIVEDIEVELQTVATWGVDADGTAKVELKVLDFLKLGEAEVTAKGKWERATTQKVKLKLSAATLNPVTNKLEKRQLSGTVKDAP